jgi:hypothetical protein
VHEKAARVGVASAVGYDEGMAIDVEWQDESGNTILAYNGPAIDAKVWSAFPNSGTCLRFIDPYGDTVFNQQQIEVLASELDALLTHSSERTPDPALISIRHFVERKRGETHTYLKFIGD